MLQAQVPEIGSFLQPDSRVGAQRSCQLTTANIHSGHLGAAAGQQDLSEASCGGARVEGSSSHAELKIIERSNELVGAARDIVIMRSIDGGRCGHLFPSPLDNRAVDDDLTGVDHGLRMATRPGQPAPDQLAIQALGHGSARPRTVSLVVGSVQCLIQLLVGLRQPVMMIGKRRRGQIGNPA